MKKIWYGWEEIVRDVGVLCRDITISEFTPDVIVGLSRGGLTPGIILSHWLRNLSNLLLPHLETFQNGKNTYQEKQTNVYSSLMIYVTLV